MIYRSPHPEIRIPDVSLPAFVLARAAGRGGRAALIDGPTGRTITYRELPGLIDRAAASLARIGLRKGEVCAIYSPNTIEYAVAVHAVWRLGGIVTTASPLYTSTELVPQLEDSRARFLFTSPAVQETAREAARQAGIERMFSFGGMDGATPFDELLAGDGAPPDVAIDPGDLAALPYSSGTTGLPKGVMLSHRNLVANILQVDASGHLQDGNDTLIGFLPFFHIYGLVVVMQLGLWAGATIVVMPRFELPQYLDLIERYAATMLHVVPPVILALAKHPAVDGRNLSSVRKLFSGAAPLGADLIERCTSRLGCVVQQGYGLTETSPATHTTSERADEIKAGSVGAPVANTECCIVDLATREAIGPGREGELWIRGPQVMRGYLGRPAETRQTLDDEGWLHTGDIARADEDGHFFIVDRLKELIKYKGLQIAPAELEAVLLSHPAVADAAVIPVADEEAGEVPKAFVVLRSPASADEILEFVASRVAPFKKIRRIAFLDQIPKSPSGKILRRLLKDADRHK
jgi:acyl-CoA synthetase (AMP-forming)/AMP-acid ligase II